MLKNIFRFILILIAYLLFTQNNFAFEFVKSENNPLSVSYINNYSNQLQHHIFKEENIYKGIFVINRPPETYYSLGYFESTDGVNWQMKKEIINTGVELSNPSIIKTNSGYVLFITRYDNNLIYKIYSSLCDFDFNCSTNLSQVITPDLNDYSENKGVFAGRPFQQENTTYMFFGAWGDDGFKIKMAYSDDLITWQKCSNRFLYGGDGPFPYQENNDLYLFFHQSNSNGIKFAKTSLPLSCDSIFMDQGSLLIKDKLYDQRHMIFPSVINDGNGGLKLYYSGRDSNWNWNFDLACTGQACLLPTSTPTPTLIPEKLPIIVIPGFMASWNKEAVIHNQTVDYSAWKLQNFVKEYDGIMNSLKNIGYEQSINLFIFPYDWRQSIEKTTDDLNNFLQKKIWNDNPNQKINIVGHSLGGLIGRIFTQKNKDKVNKIISVGSPHFGAVQFYKPVEAGEVDRDNTFLWLAEKIVLALNKSTIESDRDTIATKFSVAKDLFPTFNFLKDSFGNEISIDNLIIKNNFLPSYNQNFSDIFPIFTAIYGEKDGNTPAGFVVEPRNIIDQLLGNYLDGKPRESYFDFGDYTILSKSASQDTDSEKLYLDHGEIITKKEAIKKILGLLNINFNDDQIVEGQATKISSSLIFMIKSPATMKVEFEDSIYTEDEGIIIIPDAQSGNYKLKVQGVDSGKYEVIIGQVSENNDIWESINGEIIQSPASSQIDNYNILYNDQTAIPFLTPTVTPSPTATPYCTDQACLIPTETPVTTSTPQPTSQTSNSTSSPATSSIASSSNEIPISKESVPSVLGMSSVNEELITPTIQSTKQSKTNNEIKKSLNIWNYIWASLSSLMLGGVGYLFRKKILEK